MKTTEFLPKDRVKVSKYETSFTQNKNLAQIGKKVDQPREAVQQKAPERPEKEQNRI